MAANAAQCLRRLSLRHQSVSHAQRDHLVGCSGGLGALEILGRQIEIVHRQQQVAGLDQIVCRDRLGFSDARLRQRQRDLLARVICSFLPLKQPRDSQPRFHTVAIRCFQSAREPLHGALPIPQREQRVARIQQNRRQAGAQLFGGGDVLQRPLALVQLRIGVRQRGVDQRIVGR